MAWSKFEEAALLAAMARTPPPSFSAIAAELGRTKDSVRGKWLERHKWSNAHSAPTPEATKPAGGGEKLTTTEAGDELMMQYIGERIETVDQLIASAKIDLAIWEIVEVIANNWEVAGKAAGNKLWQTGNRQIKVRLRRRAPKPIQDGIRDLLAELRENPPSLPAPARAPVADPHLLELSLCDAHFGKRCWGQQTGTDYDLEIARDDYLGAIDDLLARVRGFDFDRVIFPIGNDFFQADNWLGTTARGTQVDNVDDRFQKVFRVGCRAVEHAIRRCREIANVDVLWIPGNHDPSTSWYMAEVLRAIFAGDEHVHIDAEPRSRKYVRYGTSLLGYTHGDGIRLDSLPLVMATESKDDWAATTWRGWRLGHFHKKKEVRHTAGDSFNGVSVTILPSLSGVDAWHYDQLYVGQARAADAHIWSHASGYVGGFTVGARSAA